MYFDVQACVINALHLLLNVHYGKYLTILSFNPSFAVYLYNRVDQIVIKGLSCMLSRQFFVTDVVPLVLVYILLMRHASLKAFTSLNFTSMQYWHVAPNKAFIIIDFHQIEAQ